MEKVNNNNIKKAVKHLSHYIIGILCFIMLNVVLYINGMTNSELPRMESMFVLAGDYTRGDTIIFNMKFSEDVNLLKEQRPADEGVASFFKVNLNNPSIQIRYIYSEADTSILIKKEEGISFMYSVSEENLDLDITDETTVESVVCEGLTFKDEDNNELVLGDYPVVSKNLEVTNWSDEKGYVELGKYPSTLVTNESALNKIIAANLSDGEVKSVADVTYMREDDSEGNIKYYVMDPIKWRVLDNDGIELTLMAENALEGRKYNDVSGDNTWSSTDSEHIRNFLNSEAEGATFRESGFLNKAFDDIEREYILEREVVTDGITTQDKVYIPSMEEMNAKNLGFLEDNDRKVLASEYALKNFTSREQGQLDDNGNQILGSDNSPVMETVWPYRDYSDDKTNYVSYRVKNLGENGDNTTALVRYDGTCDDDGIDATEVMGIRPMIKVKTSIFKYGNGEFDDPYTITEKGIREFKFISSLAKSNNNFGTKIAKIGDTITQVITFNEDLFRLPEIKIAGKDAVVVKDSEEVGVYTGTYTLDGTEYMSSNEMIEIEILNVFDKYGDEVTISDNESSNTIRYDGIKPEIQSIGTKSKTYNLKNEFIVELDFTEDVIIINDSDEEKFITCSVNVPISSNGGNLQLVEASYRVKANDEILIPRGSKINLKYVLSGDEEFVIDSNILSELDMPSIDFAQIECRDYVGNEITCDGVTKVDVKSNFEIYDGTTGYVNIGSYPKSLVRNKKIIKELDAIAVEDRLKEDLICDSEGNKYAVKKVNLPHYEYRYDYYLVEPILWRIQKINNKSILLISDTVIDLKNPAKSLHWAYDYEVDDIENGDFSDTIGETLRSYLNSSFYNFNGDYDTKFSDSGFYGKAFDNEEKNSIVLRKTLANPLNGPDEKDTYDKVFLLSDAERIHNSYGFNGDIYARGTEYAPSFVGDDEYYKDVYFNERWATRDKDRYYYSKYIRPCIEIKAGDLRIGDGTLKNPYAIKDVIFNKPKATLISNTSGTDNYVTANSTIVMEFEFDEEIKDTMALSICGENVVIEKVADRENVYRATYTFTGNESFLDEDENESGAIIALNGLEDLKGNKLVGYEPKFSRKIFFDDNEADLVNAYITRKNYVEEDVITLSLQFDEDIIVKRTSGNEGTIVMELKHPELDSFNVQYVQNSSDTEMLVPKLQQINLTYRLKDGENIDLKYVQNIFEDLTAPTLTNVEIRDKSGNEVDFTSMPKLNLVIETEAAHINPDLGYVNFGKFPREKVVDEVTLASLNSMGIQNGKIATIDDNQYLKEDEEYYKISPIKWRIIESNKTYIIVMSEDILEAKTFDNYEYGSETRDVPITDEAGTSPRAYLNSIYKDESIPYSDYGFMAKAFTDEELDYIYTTDPEEYGIGESVDKVFILSTDEVNSDKYGLDINNNRKAKINNYRNNGLEGFYNYYLRDLEIDEDDSSKHVKYIDSLGNISTASSDKIGIRPVMRIALDEFKYGKGTFIEPYSFSQTDNIVPEVETFTQTTIGKDYYDYIKKGDTISAIIEFNEPLSTIPKFNINNIIVPATSVEGSNVKFSFTYTFTGDNTEQLEEEKGFKITVNNVVDLAGNMMEEYTPDAYANLVYDNIPPTIKGISIKNGEYKPTETLPYRMIFSEDVSFKRIPGSNGDPYFGFETKVPDVDEIKYTMSRDNQLINEKSGILLPRINRGQTSITIDIFDKAITTCKNFNIGNMTITDKAGNTIDVSSLPHLSKVLLDKGENMWIQFGEYPKEQIENEFLISKLNEYGLQNGETVEHKEKEYLYRIESGKGYYYSIDPIMWKVARIIGKDAVLISDQVLERRTIKPLLYSTEYKTGIFGDAPIEGPLRPIASNENYTDLETKIGKTVRTYLNSTNEDENYYNKGFLGKVFNEDEMLNMNCVDIENDPAETFIYDRNGELVYAYTPGYSPNEVTTKDMVWLPSVFEMSELDIDKDFVYDFEREPERNDYSGIDFYALRNANNTEISMFSDFIYASTYEDLGIRPMISVNLEEFKYGEGSYENPYKITPNDIKPPVVKSTTLTTTNSSGLYVRNDVEMSLAIKYDEALLENPIVKFEDSLATVTKIDDCNYVASYIFTGEEGIEDKEEIDIEILNSVDTYGNILQSFIPDSSEKVIYDAISPFIDNIAADFGIYRVGDVLEVRLRFNEDILIQKTNNFGKIKLDLKYLHIKDDIRTEEKLEDATYEFIANEPFVSKLVEKREGINLNYTLKEDEEFNVHTFNEFIYTLSGLEFENIKITDVAGNPLIKNRIPQLSRVLDVTKWNEGSGYVTFGRYPQHRLTDEKGGNDGEKDGDIKSQLVALDPANGDILGWNNFEYLYQDGEFYRVDPILWRVIENDGVKLKLLSEYTLESKITPGYAWSTQTNDIKYTNVPIIENIELDDNKLPVIPFSEKEDEGIRTYLNTITKVEQDLENSENIKKIPFKYSGFLGKAFHEKEVNMILPYDTEKYEGQDDFSYNYTGPRDVNSTNLIYLPSVNEMDGQLLNTSKNALSTSYSKIGYTGTDKNETGASNWWLRNYGIAYNAWTGSRPIGLFSTEGGSISSSVIDNHSNFSFGVRPMLDIKLDEFKSGFGDKVFPFTINEERPAPEVDKIVLTSNNANSNYARVGSTLTAEIKFNQHLKDNPTVEIGGKKATKISSKDTTFIFQYEIDGTEDFLEGDYIEVVVKDAVNEKGYRAEEIIPQLSDFIIYDCTAPTISRIESESDVYKLDSVIPLIMVFRENVSISHIVEDDHYVLVNFNELHQGGAKFNVESSRRNVRELEGDYFVQDGDEAESLTLKDLSLYGVKIKDNAGNPLDMSNLPALLGEITITTAKLEPIITPNVDENGTEEDTVIYTIDFGKDVEGFANVLTDIKVMNGTIIEFKEDTSKSYTTYEVEVEVRRRDIDQTLIISEGACIDNYKTENQPASCTVKILKKDLSDDIVITPPNLMYDKDEKAVTVTGIVNGVPYTVEYEGINDTTYDRQMSAPINAGEYKVYVEIYKEDMKYKGSKTLESMVITPKEIPVTVTINDKVVDGTTNAEVIIAPTDRSDIEKGDIVTFTCESAVFEDSELGNAKSVTVTGIKSENKNYKAISEDPLTINGNIVEAGTEIMVSDIVTEYSGAAIEIGATTETPDATFEYEITSDSGVVTEIKDAGSYTVVVKMIRDGAEIRRKTISAYVKPRNLELLIIGQNKEYDGLRDAVVTIGASNIVIGDTCDITYSNALFADAEVGENKVVSISGIKVSNPNYSVVIEADTTADIFSKDKLERVESSIEIGKMVYKNDLVSLSHIRDNARIYYAPSSSTEFSLYVLPIAITEDLSITAYAECSGYDRSESREFNYLIRTLERIMKEINSDSRRSEDIKNIIDEVRDIRILETPGKTWDDYNRLEAEYQDKIAEELVLKKYVDNIEFNEEFARLVAKYKFISELSDNLDGSVTEIVKDPELIKEIENTKISYEELEGDVKDIVDNDLTLKIDILYDKILERLGYNIKEVVDDKEVAVYGLASRFAEFAQGTAINVNAKANSILNTYLATNYDNLNIINTYDIKVYSEKNDERTEIQPLQDEQVVVKIEVPREVKNKEFLVYHLKDGDESIDVSDIVTKIWKESSNGKEYILFNTTGFSNFVISYKESYDVTIKNTVGGHVAPEPGVYTVEKGENIELDIEAIPGYMIYSVLVNGNEYKLDTSDKGIYNVKNITKDTLIEVKFKLKYADGKPEGDGNVSGGNTGGGGGGGGTTVIEKVVEAEEEVHKPYIKGFNDGTFGPYKTMSRAELAMIFARLAEDFDENKEYTHKCSDIVEGSWYEKQAAYCYEKGIMIGFKDGTFGPHKVLTKAELIVALARYAELDHSDNKSNFEDAKGRWFEKEVVAFEDLRLLTGRPGGLLGADSEVVRSESCKLINSAIGRIPNRTKVLKLKLTKPYSDVSMTSWYISDVLEASYEHKLSEFH